MLLTRILGTITRPQYSPHTAKLNTADGSPMTTLGMTALHLRIAEFKFTHNFVICDRLLDIEIIFGRHTKEVFSFICLGQGK